MVAMIFFAFYFTCIYVVLPLVLVWSWVVWKRVERVLSPTVVLGLSGLTLATLSVALALATMAYANLVRPFPYYDPSLITG